MTTGTTDGSSPSGLSGRLRHGQQHRCVRQGLQTVPTLRDDEQVPVTPTPVGLRRHQAHASLENDDRGFTRFSCSARVVPAVSATMVCRKELTEPPIIVRAARPLLESRARRISCSAAAGRLNVSNGLPFAVRREARGDAAPRNSWLTLPSSMPR